MKYRRILLKLSGEALAADSGQLYHEETLATIARQLRACLDKGVQIAVTVGAGNIWSGRQTDEMDRNRADSMGMLATVINSIALQDAFLRYGVPARVMTTTPMEPHAEMFCADAAVRALEAGEVVIFGGGNGLPYFSTDTTASVRAAQIGADAILLAKNVDGIYDRDPNGPEGHLAQKYPTVSCTDIIHKGLRAIDLTAAALNLANGMPAVAFALNPAENILHVAEGEPIGTVIEPN